MYKPFETFQMWLKDSKIVLFKWVTIWSVLLLVIYAQGRKGDGCGQLIMVQIPGPTPNPRMLPGPHWDPWLSSDFFLNHAWNKACTTPPTRLLPMPTDPHHYWNWAVKPQFPLPVCLREKKYRGLELECQQVWGVPCLWLCSGLLALPSPLVPVRDGGQESEDSTYKSLQPPLASHG